MKKKKVLIILTIILIIAIIIIAKITIDANKPKTSINDFSSVKELIEFDGHTYISMQNSTEEGYEKDIYISFSKPTINEDGETNKNLYEIVISHVAGMLKGQNFRMIDTEKNVVVKIKFDENKNVNFYTINDDSKYWEHIKSNHQIDNYTNEPLTSMTITSQVLANIINNNWIYNNINLGTKESTVDNYEIYFDEGYKVRKLGSEIYNIIFTKNYANEIIKNITTSTSMENIENFLGTPTYKDDKFNIIGYKSNYFYIFFTEGEISVYPVGNYNEEDSKKFGKIVSELNKTGDIETFINKLTDIFPDYESYYSNNNFINIIYPLQGFEVTLGASNNNGITIYSNFQGQITDDISINDIKENKRIPTNVNAELNKNLVYETEIKRYSQDEIYRNPNDKAYLIQTDLYTLIEKNESYCFYSRNKENIDSSLNINNLTNMLDYNNTTFVYGVKNDGIYMYDAKNIQLTKILEGKENFELQKIENNTIYYDNTSIKF